MKKPSDPSKISRKLQRILRLPVEIKEVHGQLVPVRMCPLRPARGVEFRAWWRNRTHWSHKDKPEKKAIDLSGRIAIDPDDRRSKKWLGQRHRRHLRRHDPESHAAGMSPREQTSGRGPDQVRP